MLVVELVVGVGVDQDAREGGLLRGGGVRECAEREERNERVGRGAAEAHAGILEEWSLCGGASAPAQLIARTPLPPRSGGIPAYNM